MCYTEATGPVNAGLHESLPMASSCASSCGGRRIQTRISMRCNYPLYAVHYNSEALALQSVVSGCHFELVRKPFSPEE